MLPAWVNVVCVDINPSTVIKLSDRGSFQTVGLVTDVEPFLRSVVGGVATVRKQCISPRICFKYMSKPSPHILMCPPDYYGIHYEINPWMSTERQADHALAVEQWQGLRQCLLQAGAELSEVTPVDGLPDLVFTANAALIYRNQAVLARFKHEQRQGEEPHFQNWLEQHGWQVQEAPGGFCF